MLTGEVDIGLRTANFPLITKVNVVYCWIFQEILLVVMGELDIGPIPATLLAKEYIVGLMVQDIEVGLKYQPLVLVKC